MNWVALKMLTGNTGKYIGIILGVTFASLLIAQQGSIFVGLMSFTISQIKDISGPDIWVMDRNVQFIDDIKPLSDNDLYRVRGVKGVDWAVRLYKGIVRGRLADGNFQQMILIGLDDATLVGAPQDVTLGKLDDLRRPEAVFMDENGFKQLWPNEPFCLGKRFEMNDRQATIVGIFKARRTFQTFPVVYTRYSQATSFAPSERKVLSFVLAEPESGLSAEEVCRRINSQTNLLALTRQEFSNKTIVYFLRNTGIPMNFAITVILGFVVGTAIAGQTFYLFTLENLRQFGALKAMGASNLTLTRMVLLQAAVVGSVGYGLGVGGAALFGELTKSQSKLAFLMPWWILAGTGVAVVLISMLASLLSIHKLITLEPAIVFQG
jgi:putative ABC transport system permease protein